MVLLFIFLMAMEEELLKLILLLNPFYFLSLFLFILFFILSFKLVSISMFQITYKNRVIEFYLLSMIDNDLY